MSLISESMLTIATRESPLAMWQAQHTRDLLKALHPELDVHILGMTTRGDQILNSPLAKVGGKGLFVKELETALLDGRADLAVHSAKDMPMAMPQGLTLAIVDQRADPCDALLLPLTARGTDGHVVESETTIDQLPKGAIVGTSSLRRRCQILHRRPDLRCIDLRGNVNTRLRKLDEGDYDAIVLAAAGLKRLGFSHRIHQRILPDILLPAVGQGALAVEYRTDDTKVESLIEKLQDRETSLCVIAERAMNRRLEGGCQVPIAGFAQLDKNLNKELGGQSLTLKGLVGALEGDELLVAESLLLLPQPISEINDFTGLQVKAETLGLTVAEKLLEQGAQALLDQALKID